MSAGCRPAPAWPVAWLVAGTLLLAACGGEPEATGQRSAPEAAVVVWSTDTDFPLARLLTLYTKETGVPTEIRGGQSVPARTDLLVTVDMAELWRLGEDGGLRPVYSDALDANVPEALRDPMRMWFALSWRPVAIVYDPRRVDEAALSDYTALAAADWRGRLCLASPARVAHRVLVASLVARLGEAPAERIVRDWVANLAHAPFESDEKLLAAIADGRCAVGMADAGAAVARAARGADAPLGVYGPPADAGGVAAFATAAAVTRHAINPAGAAALLEWLSTETAQSLVVRDAQALPVNPRVPPGGGLGEVGAFAGGAFAVARAAGELQAAARLAERAGYR